MVSRMVSKQTRKGGKDYFESTYEDDKIKVLNDKLFEDMDDYGYYISSVEFLIKIFDETEHNAILTSLRTNNGTELLNFLSLYNKMMADSVSNANANAKGITKRKTKKKKMTMKKGYRVRR